MTDSTDNTLPAWDLTEYYNGVDDPQIDADLADDLQHAIAFEAKYKGKLASLSAKELAGAIKEMEDRAVLPRSPGKYASLMKAIHVTDEKVSALGAKLSMKGSEIGSHMIFWGLELKKLDPAKIEAMCAESPELAHYKPYLKDVLKEAPHTLSNEVEAALQKRRPASAMRLLDRMYDELDAKQRFPFPTHLVPEEDRAAIEARGDQRADGVSMLTEVEARNYRQHENEVVREAAYESLNKTYKESAYFPAFIMNHIILAKQIEDKERGHARPDSSRNLDNDVEATLVDTLAATVTENFTLNQRYLKIKAELLGKEKLKQWDELAPVPTESHVTISWSEARAIVLESFAEFSPKMAAIAKDFFDNNWIDAAPRAGKAGGAFSASNRASSHPHVLMNYTGKPRDVATLAHELGHAVHQTLAAQKQGDLMDGTSLTFAETASTFAEMLVFKKLLSRLDDPKEKIALIEEKIGDAMATTARQIAYHNFETAIHNERKQGEIPQERFAQLWKEAHAKRTGDSIEPNPKDEGHSWGAIPHFFGTPFYVYAYAFGDLLATSLYKQYEEMKSLGKSAEFEEKYLDLLSAAGTEHHSEMLPKRFGPKFDLSKAEFWQGGLDVYGALIGDLEKLMAEQKAATPAAASVVPVAHEGQAAAVPAAGKVA